mgnify:CR=1
MGSEATLLLLHVDPRGGGGGRGTWKPLSRKKFGSSGRLYGTRLARRRAGRILPVAGSIMASSCMASGHAHDVSG